MNLTLTKQIQDEFPSKNYDENFINDVVKNYNGLVNPNGDLYSDNINLLFHIFDCLEAIEHPMMREVSLEEAINNC